MLHYEILSSQIPVSSFEKQKIVDFIFRYYEEYGYSKRNIKRTIDFALKDNSQIYPSVSHGGIIITCSNENEIVGAIVMNKTGYEDILPANMLMYIATHHNYRRQGIAKKMIAKARGFTSGNIATHIIQKKQNLNFFANNGFNNKVIEMRLS
ncbi:MAG: GNAT family N-acetyltransferase [Bacteroidota bacterium]|nr:GNAT family N-acetyltransferase [Bacteroidota bacterium]